jgi:tryptophan halogenase
MSTEKNTVLNITILGGGTAGWMTAAALAELLPNEQYQISLIESDQIGSVGVGEATLPHLRYFNQKLGIDESEFMRQTNATFKVGIEFSNWEKPNTHYMHPFDEYGVNFNNISFHHYWLKQQTNGDTHSLDEYSLPVMASKQQKFDFPSSYASPLLSTYTYAYHIDAGKYASFLRRFSEKRGVRRIEGKVVDVITRSANGEIEGLTLENGSRVNGDFFIDCSGFSAQLIGKVLSSEFEDWSHWLPCNKAIAVASEKSVSAPPYTKAIARDAGWQWQIPLQNRVGNGHVYCEQFMTQQQALDVLLQNLPGDAISEPNFLSFKAGKRSTMWSKNCLAIGLSSGFLEPLESTSIYLIQSAIMKLVELFPDTQNMQVKAKELNRFMNMEMERIRDFLILHYHATKRKDTGFWQYCQDMNIPDSLKEKMALFKQCGVIESYQHGLFLTPSWVAVFIGQGYIPQHIDPRVSQIAPDILAKKMAALRHSISKICYSMPSHLQTLENVCNKNNTHNSTHKSSAVSLNLYGGK